MKTDHKIYTGIALSIGLVMGYTVFTNIYFLLVTNINFSYNWRLLTSMLPAFVTLAGVLIFAGSKFQRTGLLQIAMCYLIFHFPFFLIQLYQRLSDNFASASVHLGRQSFLLPLLLSTILFVASCIGLWLLLKRRVIALTEISIDGEIISEFSPAKASLRFVNRLIDLLFIISFLYTQVVDNYWMRNLFRDTASARCGSSSSLSQVVTTSSLKAFLIQRSANVPPQQ